MNAKDYYQKEILKDGSPVVVRAIRPDDKQALVEGLRRLSSDSTYSRFFYPKRKFSERELNFLTELDFDLHVAIGVGLLDGDGMLPIGIGRYIVDKSRPSRAEVAFAVADEFQGIGVGSLLLKQLVELARGSGIQELFGTTLDTNKNMLSLFERSNLPMRRNTADGIVEIILSIAESN